MLYRITFWLYFMAATMLCAFALLMKGYATDFLKLILISFAVGFIVSVIINAIVKSIVHWIQWMINPNDYREKYIARRRP